jgi:hypothetical protein
MLFVYSRVGKNRDTSRGTPAGAGAGRGASYKTASLVTQLSRHGVAIAYTDLLAVGLILIFGCSLLELLVTWDGLEGSSRKQQGGL